MANLKPKYLQAETARDRWMISYMDVLTILLIFFVAVAAKSLERPKEQKAIPLIAKVMTPVPPPETRRTLLEAQKNLEKNGLEMRMEPRGLVISIPQAVLFPSGEDEIGPKAKLIVAQIAGVLRGISNPVSLVGHADTVPIHNRHFKDNWDLATARSLKLLNLLSHDYGIEESRLSVASYGSYRPASSNETADGRARNRRVEIVISDEPGGEK